MTAPSILLPILSIVFKTVYVILQSGRLHYVRSLILCIDCLLEPTVIIINTR